MVSGWVAFPFNSLFEMLEVIAQDSTAKKLFELSILYLRCRILYPEFDGDGKLTFNSLFEMPSSSFTCILEPYVSFNSLFEMRAGLRHDVDISIAPSQLSILYLRCPDFGPLYEQSLDIANFQFSI